MLSRGHFTFSPLSSTWWSTMPFWSLYLSIFASWLCSLATEHLPSMYKGLGSIPSTENKQTNKQTKIYQFQIFHRNENIKANFSWLSSCLLHDVFKAPPYCNMCWYVSNIYGWLIFYCMGRQLLFIHSLVWGRILRPTPRAAGKSCGRGQSARLLSGGGGEWRVELLQCF